MQEIQKPLSTEFDNSPWKTQIKARDDDMESIKTSDDPERKLFELIFGHSEGIKCWKPLHRLQWRQQPCRSCEPFLPTAITPLDECIVAILWEASHCDSCRDVLTAGQTTKLSNLWDVAAFLRSAASYQSKSEIVRTYPADPSLNGRVLLTLFKNELIRLALECLRSCLEVLRLVKSGFILESMHEGCEKSQCKIDCILDAERSIKLYVDELSRVFFKKENIRFKEGWWLSTFYSLGIQGLVRRALLQLKPESGTDDETKQYLHLVIRLFGASSGPYDPLTRNYAISAKGEDKSMAEDFKAAQLSLHQYKWTSAGVSGSVHYLKQLFEDKGELLKQTQMTLQSLGWTANTQLLKLYKFTVQKGKEPYFDLRSQWPATPETPQRVYLDHPS